jgi:hypothetical protein
VKNPKVEEIYQQGLKKLDMYYDYFDRPKKTKKKTKVEEKPIEDTPCEELL